MVRAPCCDKMGVKKGPWTPDEDEKLLSYIEKHGHGSWRAVPIKAGLLRCGKSCRLRWTNYLRPDIKRGKFTLQEEQTIIQLHALLGNRWSAIASYLDKRTDNEIKNHWNTHLKKRLIKMGIDPVTHKPNTEGAHSDVMSHKAQWESARLEAEARLTTHPKKPLVRPYSFPTNNPCYMDTSNYPLTLENSMIFTNVMDSEVSVCSSDNATVLPHYHHLMMYDHENKEDFTEEDGKSYWSNILQMVNSSSSSVTASATSANDGDDYRVSAFSPSLS